MRILHICRQYYPSIGGVERFVSDLAGRLMPDGYGVEIATLNRLWHSSAKLASLEIVNGIKVHRLPFWGGPLYFLAPAVLGLVAQFDVLHIHNTDFFLDFLTATRWFHHKPIVVSTHGGFFHTGSRAAIKGLYFRWVTQRSLLAASVVVPNSAGDMQRFASYTRRVVRIDNAIDYRTFAAVEHQPIAGRLITVGRLAENKNLQGLLNVFSTAHRLRPELSLVIVGDGLEHSKVEGLIAELSIPKAVIWLGLVDQADLLAELGKAEMFLSAAKYEGFGLALLEAMAAGVIPVVNAIEAFEALVTHGRNGFVINYDQAELAGQLLAKVAGLPETEKRRLSKEAKRQAEKYSWDVAIPKFEKVYQQALSVTKNQP